MARRKTFCNHKTCPDRRQTCRICRCSRHTIQYHWQRSSHPSHIVRVLGKRQFGTTKPTVIWYGSHPTVVLEGSIPTVVPNGVLNLHIIPTKRCKCCGYISIGEDI